MADFVAIITMLSAIAALAGIVFLFLKSSSHFPMKFMGVILVITAGFLPSLFHLNLPDSLVNQWFYF